MVIKTAIANCPLNGGNKPTQHPHKVEHKVLGRRRHMRAKSEVAKNIVLVPDPKPTLAVDHFQYRVLYWKRYMCRMRSGNETTKNTVQ